MPLRLYKRLQARLYARLLGFGGLGGRGGLGRGGGFPGRGGGFPGRQSGFSTAEGLAGAALAVVALIAIWAAMKTFGLDIIKWMQQQITGAGGGAG
jgi:hypothetical protein